MIILVLLLSVIVVLILAIALKPLVQNELNKVRNETTSLLKDDDVMISNISGNSVEIKALNDDHQSDGPRSPGETGLEFHATPGGGNFEMRYDYWDPWAGSDVSSAPETSYSRDGTLDQHDSRDSHEFQEPSGSGSGSGSGDSGSGQTPDINDSDDNQMTVLIEEHRGKPGKTPRRLRHANFEMCC